MSSVPLNTNPFPEQFPQPGAQRDQNHDQKQDYAQAAARTVTAGGATKAAAVGLFAGFAGFGAGAVNLAIAASLLLAPAADARPVNTLSVAAGAIAGIWGCALLAWTVLTLRRGHMPWAAGTMAMLAAAAFVHAAAAAGQGLGGGSLSGHGLSGPSPNGGSLVVSQLAALLLTLMIVASAGWLRRQGTSGDKATATVTASAAGADTAGLRPGRLLLAAFGCAVLVAAVATPGLAASTAGQFAVPHGSHGIPAPGGQHHGH